MSIFAHILSLFHRELNTLEIIIYGYFYNGNYTKFPFPMAVRGKINEFPELRRKLLRKFSRRTKGQLRVINIQDFGKIENSHSEKPPRYELTRNTWDRIPNPKWKNRKAKSAIVWNKKFACTEKGKEYTVICKYAKRKEYVRAENAPYTG